MLTLRGCASFAERLLDSFAIDAPSQIDLEAIALYKGALVVAQPIDGSAARLVRKGERALIVVRQEAQGTPHGRFCIAHELGHFCLHKKQDQLTRACTEGMIVGHNARSEEREASAFAAGLLMPSRLFRSQCGTNPPDRVQIESLASEFTVSLTAAALRYVDMGRWVTAVLLSKRGTVQWARAAKDFPGELPKRGVPLHGDSLAARGQSDSALVAAEVWLAHRRAGRSQYLLETSFAMPRYGQVLTVLAVVSDGQLEGLRSARNASCRRSGENADYIARLDSRLIARPQSGAEVGEPCLRHQPRRTGVRYRQASHRARHRAALAQGLPLTQRFNGSQSSVLHLPG